MTNLRSRHVRLLFALMIAALQTIFGGALPASAAPGEVVAEVSTPEGDTVQYLGIAKAVAFDGKYLYYAEYAGHVLHRIDVPPPGPSVPATGHIDIPIVGGVGGVMTIAYDFGRDMFWAVSGDGSAIYLISKTGMATRQFTVDPATSLPGGCKTTTCPSEVKIAYDRADDTIWYSPDTTKRVYHFSTSPDALGKAILIGYFDVDVAPNDMGAECPYGSYVSGIATGGSDLFFEVSACNYYFEYTKAGTKVAAIARAFETSGGLTCDNLSYAVSVIWMRDGWNSHIYALEQPRANACVFGGG